MAEIIDDTSAHPAVVQETGQKPRDVAEKTLWPKDSMASSPHTFHNALVAAKNFIVENEGDKATINVNTAQHPEAARWRSEAARLKTELSDPAVQSLFASKAGAEVWPINTFLKDKWFTIELKDQGEWLYVASVFKQTVAWKNKGEKTQINWTDDQAKPKEAVKLWKDWINQYTVDDKKIFELSTRDDSKVYMMESGNMKTTPIDFYQKIRDINGKKGVASPIWDSITFPKVDLKESGSIDWLVWAKVGSYTVNQAKYENMLTMDENWAEAKAAVAIAWSRGIRIPSAPDIIDGPFIVWFTKPGRDGKDIITFAARVGENALKKVEKQD